MQSKGLEKPFIDILGSFPLLFRTWVICNREVFQGRDSEAPLAGFHKQWRRIIRRRRAEICKRLHKERIVKKNIIPSGIINKILEKLYY